MLLRRGLCVLVTAACATVSTVSAASASPALANRTFHLGSIYVITGTTGTWAGSHQHMLGTVSLSGSWNGGRWQMIARVEAKRPNGSYRFVVRPRRRGVLHLRLGTPDEAVYRVTLRVI
ncbi:MAG: hypothetical protein ACXVY6_14245 [Gaiellaceae bacterium]